VGPSPQWPRACQAAPAGTPKTFHVAYTQRRGRDVELRGTPWNAFFYLQKPQTLDLKRRHALGGALSKFANQLLTRGRSYWQFCSSHLISNLPAYQCAKFGALNPRINKVRSHKIWLGAPSQVPTARFSIQMIFGLSDQVSMLSTASGTIMERNLHVSFHS
jgi:hypothetical protein